MKRPYVLLSVAASIDGYINDGTDVGLPLSNAEDFDRVDQVRADCDAILIGAGTLRGDDPRMTVKSEERRGQREAAGKPAYPAKLLITASGNVDPSIRWFTTPGHRIIYTVDQAAADLKERIGDLADIVTMGPAVDYANMLDDLGSRGIESVMVEGGEQVHTTLLTEGHVDEIHFVLAPLLVGSGPRFLAETDYPWPPETRMEVLEIEPIGDVVLVRYKIDKSYHQ